MKFKKEAKIAVIVTLIMLLFLWGYNYLKGRNLFSSYNYYRAQFARVDGLQKSSAVTINGFVVGLVSDIQFVSSKMDRLAVEIGVKKSFQIPSDSKILISSDMLGGKSIVLALGNSTVMVQSGDTLAGGILPGLIDKLEPIANNAKNTMAHIDSLVLALQKTFDSSTQSSVQSIIANVEQLIVAERRKISAILTNFQTLSGNLQQNSDSITTLIANLNVFAANLAASDVKNTVQTASRSLERLNTLLADIGSGQGTLGKLAKDDSLYIYLQQSANDLDKLLIDLRENPKNYVHFSLFGNRTKEKK